MAKAKRDTAAGPDEKVKDEAELTTEPEKTEPEKTEPEKTEPEKTEPEKTEPEKTEPEKTEPEAAMPSGGVMMVPPEGCTGIKVAGTELNVKDNGLCFIPNEHIEVAKSHGFVVSEKQEG